MRIAIDITVTIGQKTGIGLYVHNLIENLARVDKENEYLLYTHFWRSFKTKKKTLSLPVQPNFRLVVKRFPNRITNLLFNYLHLPIDFFLPPTDIVHCTCYLTPISKRSKSIVTIYDLTPLLFPEFHVEHIKKVIFKGLLNSVCKVDKIIAISESTKKDVMRLFHIPEDKIEVIYGAADEIYHPIEDPEILKQVRAKYKIPHKFILFVGIIEPRKNIARLIQAFSILKKKFEHKLVIVGRKGWLYDEIFAQVRRSHLGEEVIFTGYVPREDLPALYSATELFIYPSLYEGFGLPPLEAMACGTPVITSNVSSLPEVMGEAGILIDPNNVDELSRAIDSVLSDENLREELREKGLRQAKKFSWERCAQETIKVYQEVGN